MQNYCFYKPGGRIIQYGRCPRKDIKLQSWPSCLLFELTSTTEPPFEQHYISENNQHLQCEDYNLDTLPLPCSISIEGIEYEVTEAPVFSFDAPGKYEVSVRPADAKYQDKEFTIEY